MLDLSGDYEAAARELATALKAQRRLVAGDPNNAALRRDLAETLTRLGMACIELADRKLEARKAADEAVRTLVGLDDDESDLRLAEAYRARGYVVKRVAAKVAGGDQTADGGSRSEARKDYLSADKILGRLIEGARGDEARGDEARRLSYEDRRAMVANNLANLDREDGRSEAAAAAYRQAADLWRKLLAPPAPGQAPPGSDARRYNHVLNLALATENLLTLDTARGRYADAEKSGEEARRSWQELERFDPDKSRESLVRVDRMLGFLHLNRCRRAERRGESCLAECWASQVGEDCARALENLRRIEPDGKIERVREEGRCLLLLAGRFAVAEPRASGADLRVALGEAKEALRIFEPLIPSGARGAVNDEAMLALAWRLLGDTRAAQAEDHAENGGGSDTATLVDEADKAYRTACERADALISGLKIVLYESHAAEHHWRRARFLNRASRLLGNGSTSSIDERAREASGAATRSIDLATLVLGKDRTDDRARLSLVYALQERALARARLNDPRGVEEDSGEALKMATERAESLNEPDADRPFSLLYGLAAARAQASLPSPNHSPANDAHVRAAIHLLKQPSVQDRLAEPGARARLASDPDFQALKSETEFREIVGDWVDRVPKPAR
jgi:hypothetical protein